jgi:hypothetical protein
MLSRLFYPKTTTSYEKFYVTINPAVTTENCCFLSIFLITKESKNELGDSTGLFRNLSNSRHAAENAHATQTSDVRGGLTRLTVVPEPFIVPSPGFSCNYFLDFVPYFQASCTNYRRSAQSRFIWYFETKIAANRFFFLFSPFSILRIHNEPLFDSLA